MTDPKEHDEHEHEDDHDHEHEEAEETAEHEPHVAAPVVPIAVQVKGMAGRTDATMKLGQTYARPLTGGPARGTANGDHVATQGKNVKRSTGKIQISNSSQRLGKRFGR